MEKVTLADVCVAVQEQTDVSQARRLAVAMAERLGFDAAAAGNAGLVVTEAARNLLKHAGGGQVILRGAESGAGLEILALDKGPGVADMARCFEDGYSTAGTPGNGLGAIARLSGTYGMYSQRGAGTALMARIAGHAPSQRAGRFAASGVSLPVAGETESGDAWIFQETALGGRLTVADGLGHGPFAAEAARAAIEAAAAHPEDSAQELVERMHAACRPTRGAAVAVAEVDTAAHVVRFAGLGNICGMILGGAGGVRSMVSGAGSAGHQAHKIRTFTYPWDARSLLLMHSDGLQTHWSFDAYPGLTERHPSLIAGVLYRDHMRGRDDVTVVAARENRAGEPAG